MRLGRSVRDGDGRYAALEGVLRREPPLGGERVQVAELDEEMKELVDRVEGRHLFVQGPPGLREDVEGRAADPAPARPRQARRGRRDEPQGDPQPARRDRRGRPRACRR